jgi:hypothetical protein
MVILLEGSTHAPDALLESHRSVAKPFKPWR